MRNLIKKWFFSYFLNVGCFRDLYKIDPEIFPKWIKFNGSNKVLDIVYDDFHIEYHNSNIQGTYQLKISIIYYEEEDAQEFVVYDKKQKIHIRGPWDNSIIDAFRNIKKIVQGLKMKQERSEEEEQNKIINILKKKYER